MISSLHCQSAVEKRKWWRTWRANEYLTSDRGWPACGRLGRQTSTRTKTSARLKITFVNVTYSKGWTGSLPLGSLTFSCWKRYLKVYFYYRRWLLYLYRILLWLTKRQGETSEPSHERKVVYDILLQLLRHNHELCCSLCSKFRRNREGRMAQVWSLGRPLDQNAGRDEWQDSWVPGWFLL